MPVPMKEENKLEEAWDHLRNYSKRRSNGQASNSHEDELFAEDLVQQEPVNTLLEDVEGTEDVWR